MKDLMEIVQRMDNVDFSQVSASQKKDFIMAEARKLSMDELSMEVLLKRNNC